MPSSNNEILITLSARATQFEAGLRQSQAAVKGLEATVSGLQRRLAQTAPATAQAASGLQGLATISGGLTKQLAGLAAGYVSVQAAAQGVGAVMQAGMQAERQQRAWAAIAGGATHASEELAFLRTTADKMGVSFVALEQGYRNITASAKGSTLAGQATRQIFLDITQALQTLGAPSEAVAGSMRALSQMMSAGNVQADELKNELGSHLPGVMTLAAKSMGLTTQEFRKLQDAGGVLTTEFLPKFASMVRQTYVPTTISATENTRTLEQELNRTGNVLRDLAATEFRNSGIEGWLKRVISGLADVGRDAVASKQRLDEMRQSQLTEMISAAAPGRPLTEKATRETTATLDALEQQIIASHSRLMQMTRDQTRFSTMDSWKQFLLEPRDLALRIQTEEKFFQALRAKRETFLKTIPTLDTRPPIPMPGEGPGFAREQLALQGRQKTLADEVQRILKSVEDVGKAGLSLEHSPFEILREQAKVLADETEKLELRFKDLLRAGPGLPLAGAVIRRAPGEQQTLFREMGTRYGVDPALLEAIASTESNFNPRAVSRKGAQGVMQFMPDTARRMGITDPFDPKQSIEGAAKLMRQLTDQFSGDVRLALAAYNAGPAVAAKALASYPETQAYVPEVLRRQAAMQGPPSGAALLQPLLDRREQLRGEESVHTITDLQIRTVQENRAEYERLTKSLDTYTTSLNSQYRAQELFRASLQASEGDLSGMEESLQRVEEDLTAGTNSLSAFERAQVTRTIASRLALEPDEALVRTMWAQVEAHNAAATALANDTKSVEAFTKAQQDLADRTALVRKELQNVDDILEQLDAERPGGLTDIILSMKEGMPTLDAYETQMRRLQGLGAGEGSLRLAEGLRHRSTAEFQAIEQGAANLSSSLEDTLIASLTRGGDAWKEFGRIAVEELLRVLLNATKFRETLTGLLTKAGTALLNILGGVSNTPSTFPAQSTPSTPLPELQHGGALFANQRGLVGEVGQELLLSQGQMQLVGTRGPEVIRPKSLALVIPHRETMQLLRQGHSRGSSLPFGMRASVDRQLMIMKTAKQQGRMSAIDWGAVARDRMPETPSIQTHRPTQESSVQRMARRETGGAILGGANYVVGEAGIEAAIGMKGSHPGAGRRQSERPIVVNMVVNAKDAPSFVRSASEIERRIAQAVQNAQRRL